MRILIHSPAFPPSVGGLEFMSRMLAEEFAALGEWPVVVTTTPDPAHVSLGLEVVRRPSPRAFFRLVQEADVLLLQNVSLKALWPLALLRRPVVVAHHGPYRRPGGAMGWRDRLKYRYARHVVNVACSAAVGADLPPGTRVVHSAYDDRIFQRREGVRDRDVAFVGRFVSDKGGDLLLRALGQLRRAGSVLRTTMVGLGPEEPALRALCREEGLGAQVEFAGPLDGRAVAGLMNRHRIVAIPSRNEPFGIVALEAIACGCVPVASDTGGLPEAVGACGLLFPREDVGRLAARLALASGDAAVGAQCVAGAASHLERFKRRPTARAYLEVLREAVREGGHPRC